MRNRILFLDDRWKEENWKESFDQWLPECTEVIYEEHGYKAIEKLVESPDIKLVFLDLQFQDQPEQGEQILNDIKEQYPNLRVIILTSINDAQLALRLVHDEKKAYYYFFKDAIDPDQVKKLIENAIESYDLKAESIRKTDVGMIIGENLALKEVLRVTEKASQVDSTVLITGESGTGKELVARAIHTNSKRRNHLFVPVNCAAISENLVESELFGHVRGAFTDAIRDKQGRFEKADGGTLFLDEIGDLKLHHQAQLLRVIQFGEFERVGSEKTIRVDVRVIAATNRNLEQEIQQGLFRRDLYYRLNVFRIHIPPLRERKEDIPELVRHIIQRLGNKLGDWKDVSNGGLEFLAQYDWPGNVRELENVIERATITSSNENLTKEDFIQLIKLEPSVSQEESLIDTWASKVMLSTAKWEDIRREFAARGDMRRRIMDMIIRRFIREKEHRPSGDELAQLLDIQRNNLNQILNNLGISLREYD